jgi:hypothetical protein
MEWLLIWILFSILSAVVGSRKGAAFAAFFLGLILGPVGVLLALTFEAMTILGILLDNAADGTRLSVLSPRDVPPHIIRTRWGAESQLSRIGRFGPCASH